MAPGLVTRPISSMNISLRPTRPGRGNTCSVEEQLRAKCSELELVKKAREAAQDELKDAAQWGEKMLREICSKEKAWLEERERLRSELRIAESSSRAEAGQDILQELAASQAKVRAEAMKAEAFQQSLTAARAALSRKAEEKAFAEAAKQHAVEAAAVQAVKQEALEANLARAEQMVSKHAAAEADAKANIRKAQVAVEEARKEAEDARATAAAETAKAEAATEAARAEAAKAEAAKIAFDEARRKAEDAQAAASIEIAKAEIQQLAASAKAEVSEVGSEKTKSLGLPEACVSAAFAEFDGTEGSVASTMTPRSTSPRTDVDKVYTEETTDEKGNAEISDAEVATETESHKDDFYSFDETDDIHSPPRCIPPEEFQDPEPEAESSPISHKKRRPFETLMSSGNSLLPSFFCGSSDMKKQPSAVLQRDDGTSAARKSPPMQQRRAKRATTHANCGRKKTQQSLKARSAHLLRVFPPRCWLWATVCTVITLVILCALGSSDILRLDATRENSMVEEEVRVDHFSVSIASTAAPSMVSEARRVFDVNPEPRHALKLANLLMDGGQASEALDVLLRAIEHVRSAAIRWTDDLAKMLCALNNNAGTLLVRAGEVDRAVHYYQRALKYLSAEEHWNSHLEYRYQVRLNLAAVEMMRSNWDVCSKEAQLASSESANLSDRPSQYLAQSLLSGCLFQNDAEKALQEARVAMRLAPEDKVESARENCHVLEEAVVRSIAAVRMGKDVNVRPNMHLAHTFKFLMPDW